MGRGYAARVLGTLAITSLLIIALTPSLVTAESLTYTYRLDTSGVATVTVIATNLSGLYTYTVLLDKGVIPETVSVINASNGEPVPTNLTGNKLTIYLMNMTSSVIITYTAVVGNLTTEGYVVAVVSPQGPANIVLPKGAALLYFNGSPSISMKGSVIVLSYSGAGTYEVKYLPPPPPTTTTTTTTTATVTKSLTTTATATTTPTKSATSTTTTTTTSATPVTTTATKTVTTSTTTVTSKSATTTTSVSTTSPTTTKSLTTTSLSTTSTTKPLTTTLKTSTTSPTTTSTVASVSTGTTVRTKSAVVKTSKASPVTTKTTTTPSTTTTPKPSGPAIPTGLIAGVVAAIVAASIIASLLRRRPRTAQATSVPMEVIREELDERDAEILKALSEESMNISALAKKLGLSKSVVWRRANKLSRLGLISKVEEGGKVILKITNEGIKALDNILKGGK